MPITLRKFDAQVKDPDTGEMVPAGLLSSDSIEAIEAAETAAVAAVEGKQAAAEAAIELKGETTRESIPADYTELSDEVDELNTQLTFATGIELIEIPAANQGKYLHITNNVIDVGHPATSSSGYGYVIVPCSAGEIFTVSGVSANSEPMAWAFTDGNYEIKEKAGSNITVTDAVITAPENAEWLVIHDKAPYRVSHRGKSVPESIGVLSNLLTDRKDNLVDATNEVLNDLKEWNGIKYTFFANQHNLVNGTYSNQDGSITPSTIRIRPATPIYIDSDSYVVFVPGEKITQILCGVKADGESSYSVGASWRGEYVLKFEAGTYVIPIFKTTPDSNITPSDYDAKMYIVSEKALFVAQSKDYIRTLDYYAYRDNAKIQTEQGSIGISNNWIVSTYISAIQGEQYIWMPGSSDSLAFLGIYNSAKELLIAYSNILKPRIITMPQNTAYIRASLYKESSARLSTINGETVFAWNAIGQVYNNDNIALDNEYEVMPEDWPHEVGYRRSQQLANIKWTPKNNVPRVIYYGGDSYFPADVERTGLLYSDVYGTNKVVGYDVSLETFMTAVNNPYSLLYTENCNPGINESAYDITYEYGDPDTAAYFGTACNHFAMYAIGSPIAYSSYDLQRFADTENFPFERVYDQSANGLQLLDVLGTSGHVALVTRLWKTKRGEVTRVRLSQAGVEGVVNSSVQTAEAFNTWLKNASYTIFRYKDLYKNIKYEKSPFVAIENETLTPYVYNDDICTFAGDYACFAEGDLLYINYTKGNYTELEVYKNDTLLETITLDNSADVHAVNLSTKNYTYGKYKARLKNGSNYSDFTYWEIVNATISLSGDTLSFSSENGVPLYWMWIKVDGIYPGYTYKKVKITDDQISEGSVDVSDRSAEHPRMKVVFQGDYGRIARILA